MNSVLNPEAPEFYPDLTTVTKDGYTTVHRTIRSSNQMPHGASHNLFKTCTDFNIVTCQISENVVVQANQIVVSELPAVKLRLYDNEYNLEKVVDANDIMLDRVNVRVDSLSGANRPSEDQVVGRLPRAAWDHAPVITKIQMGSTMLIGAKNIARPQLLFKEPVDNSESLWVPRISDKPNNIKPLALNILYNDAGEAVGYEHPYLVELQVYRPAPALVEPDARPAAFPPPLERSPLTLVESEAQVDALVAHLAAQPELAVDLEHHSYRSYQGITCLIQISTAAGGDFIVDALAARDHLHKLNQVFTDPTKLKVFHGAASDVLWLQRDFGVYVVGMFDTHRAAKALGLPALSLKALLLRYCGISADKKFQLADWRIRPLPAELVAYARSDTHYLLYVWRRMKQALLDAAAGQPHLLLSVFEASRQICATTYNKEVIREDSHLSLYVRSRKTFNARQMAALRMLYKWRDAHARELDESTTYLLPNHMLLCLAETLPREVQGVSALCSPMPPFVNQHLITLHRMLLSCRELPLEPQLLRAMRGAAPAPAAPAAAPAAPHPHPPAAQHPHDLLHLPEATVEQGINLEAAEQLLAEPAGAAPDVPAFAPAAARAPPVPPLAPHRVVSDLNVDAKLFIPPYDRYQKYRCLAQIEEMKEFKEREAKIAAIGKGNELIKAEVLAKLQRACAYASENTRVLDSDNVSDPASDHASDHAASDALRPPPPPPAPAPLPSDADRPARPADTTRPAAPPLAAGKAQRKRKISDKGTQAREGREGGEARPAPRLKPPRYKNVNYRKFFNDTEKAHKQPKMNFKKQK